MNGQQKFSEDLSFGQKHENIFVERLRKEYDYVETTQGKGCFSAYDIACYKFDENGDYAFYEKDGITFISNMFLIKTFECKADREAHKYGNSFFIEVQCNNKKSGLAKTKATDYAYFCVRALEVEYDLYIIPTEILKDFIINKQYTKTYSRAGDRGVVIGHIIPNNLIEKFRVHSKRVGWLGGKV